MSASVSDRPLVDRPVGERPAAERPVVERPVAGSGSSSVRRGLRFELVKLLAAWRIRLVLVACWIGPGLLVAVVSGQTSLPADTVFGRWMGQSGWAGPLLVLSFAGSWILPVLTSLVAGDLFASEDRLGTWRQLLVAFRSPRRIFAAKTLAGLSVIVVMTIGLAVSAVVGGLVAVGDRPLVGLTGQSLPPGHAAGAVLLAWAGALAPTLAFAAVGLLGSIVLGRSPMGLAVSALFALLLGAAQMLPLAAVVRVALPSYGFIAWRGLFTEPVQTGPLVAGILVSLVWTSVATGLAYVLFLRRDFTDSSSDGLGRRAVSWAVGPLVVLFALTVAVLAVASRASGSGIDRPRLETSLATAYAHLYRLQTRELHRPGVTERQLRATASCDRGGALVADAGPGNDWRCVVTWRLPGSTAIGSAVYQLDVTPDGRYTADGDGPQEVNGYFQLRTSTGDAPNPLWQLDGLVDLLTPTPKG